MEIAEKDLNLTIENVLYSIQEGLARGWRGRRGTLLNILSSSKCLVVWCSYTWIQILYPDIYDFLDRWPSEGFFFNIAEKKEFHYGCILSAFPRFIPFTFDRRAPGEWKAIRFVFFLQDLASLYNTHKLTDRLNVSIMLHYNILWYVLEWISSSVVLLCMYVCVFFFSNRHSLNCHVVWHKRDFNFEFLWLELQRLVIQCRHIIMQKNHFKSKKKKCKKICQPKGNIF